MAVEKLDVTDHPVAKRAFVFLPDGKVKLKYEASFDDF